MLSNTSLGMLARCPQAWMWRYLFGVREPPAGVLHSGNAGHAAIEFANLHHIERGIWPSERQVQMAFQRSWEVELKRFHEQGWELNWREEKGEVAKKQTELLLPLYLKNDPFVPAKAEERFEFNLQETYGTKHIKTFVGKIDCVDVHGNVVDYKFGTKRKGDSDMNFDLQPFSYAAALNRPIDFCFAQLLRSKTNVKEPYGNLRVELGWTKRTETDIEWFMESFLPGMVQRADTGITMIYEAYGLDPKWKEDGALCEALNKLYPPTVNWACDSFCAYRKEDMCELRL